jgi:hypothetical protein
MAIGDFILPKNMSQVKWVLVAGTGQYHLPDSVLWVSQALGTELGRRGFGLVNGGWEGVDWVVSETFAKELEGKGVPLASLLLQVVVNAAITNIPEDELFTFRLAHWNSLKALNIATQSF